MKKGDLIVIAVIAALALFFVFLQPTGEGKQVVIRQDNRIVYEVPLFENAVYELEGNTVEVRDGKVFMQSASCQNQLCTHHQKIDSIGETIVCLPNRVSITVEE